MARGAPSTYSVEITDVVCERLAEGESLVEICRDRAMPSMAAIFSWLSKHEDFAERYARARETQAERYAAEVIAISDDGSADYTVVSKDGKYTVQIDQEAIGRSRLRMDARKWAAEKLKPTVYGNKQFVEHSGVIGLVDVSDEDLRAEIIELVATGRFKLPPGVELAESEPEAEDDFSDIA